MSHTPGPWKTTQFGAFVYTENGQKEICQMFGRNGDDFLNNEENARLIAAAPELLEAVKQLMKSMETGMVDFNSFDEANWQFALSAIAKAEPC